MQSAPAASTKPPHWRGGPWQRPQQHLRKEDIPQNALRSAEATNMRHWKCQSTAAQSRSIELFSCNSYECRTILLSPSNRKLSEICKGFAPRSTTSRQPPWVSSQNRLLGIRPGSSPLAQALRNPSNPISALATSKAGLNLQGAGSCTGLTLPIFRRGSKSTQLLRKRIIKH